MQIEGIILDWAGTTLDYGCQAPAVVYREIFKQFGVPISIEEARRPMGAHKKVHMSKILQDPAVKERWKEAKGEYPTEADLDAMFEKFVPMQMEVLKEHTDFIPGTIEAIAEMRKRNIKIGSTTGYMIEMTELLKGIAAEKGYSPDSCVCAEEVPEGRPAPWMCVRNAEMLGIFPFYKIIKVDDTVPGILEGLNAGMWTIGLAKSGNEMGLTEQEINDLEKNDPEKYQSLLDAAYDRMDDAGADYVVDTIADLMPVIDDINSRLMELEAESEATA